MWSRECRGGSSGGRRHWRSGGWSGERGAAAAVAVVWDSDAGGMLRVFALSLWPLLGQSQRRRELFPILELWNGEGRKSCVHFPSRKRAMPRCWLPLFSPMHAKAEVVSHTCDRPASLDLLPVPVSLLSVPKSSTIHPSDVNFICGKLFPLLLCTLPLIIICHMFLPQESWWSSNTRLS